MTKVIPSDSSSRDRQPRFRAERKNLITAAVAAIVTICDRRGNDDEVCYFVQRDRDRERLAKRLLRRLRELGVDVEVKRKAA